MKLSGKSADGVYEIQNLPDFKINVYCDLSLHSDYGWIVIQRRVDGSSDFFRYWNDYKTGFGDLNGNFWIGLDNLHKLAGPERRNILRVDLKHISSSSLYYAAYSTFEVGDESSGYKLTVNGYYGR